MIYFTNSRSLINEHVKDNFKDKSVINYILLFYIEAMLYDQLFLANHNFDKIESPIQFVFFSILFGTFFTLVLKKILEEFWRANGGGNSRDFLNRVISLAWVFHFRASLFLLPIVVLFKIFSNIDGSNFIVPLLLVLLTATIYYLYYVFQNVKKSLGEIYEQTKNHV